MIPENSIYIRTLKWASDRGTYGFTLDELKAAVTKDEEEWRYVQRMFMGQINGEPHLIFHDAGASGDYRYFLTGSGAAAAVDYLELKEAQKSGRWAMYFAIASLIVSIFVGIAQIYFDVFYTPNTPAAPDKTTEFCCKG